MNCSNRGSIISTGDGAGGLFGIVRIDWSSPSNSTTVLAFSGSYNQGAVNGTDDVGGMIGLLLGGTSHDPQLSFDSCFSNAEVSASKASPHIGAYIGEFPSTYQGQNLTGHVVFTNSFYSSVPGCLAVDGSSNTITLNNLGGGSYSLTMPSSDVTISAN